MRTWIAALTMLGGLAAHAGPPGDGRDMDMGHPGRGDGQGQSSGNRVLYTVRNLSSLGGTSSAGNGLTDNGWVTGSSNLAGDTASHGTIWIRGFLVDLGTLGGPNSNVAWPVKNDHGVVSGIAETNDPNPLGERWSCRFFFASTTGKVCRGVVWEFGQIRALPLFPGGTMSFATGTNNQRETVGWSENGVLDPTCTGSQKLQFRAAMWGPGPTQMQELPPLPPDSTSAATAVNDHGQAVGISGACSIAVGGLSARGMVLWENGRATEIPSCGGIAWNTPMAINRWGDVVGFANASAADGASPNFRAFFWSRRTGLKMLLLPGDTSSQALGINDWGQVVGQSCGPSVCRGFLYQNGQIVDLNDHLAPGYPGHIEFAGDIDPHGRITGQASQGGQFYAFIATPGGGD